MKAEVYLMMNWKHAASCMLASALAFSGVFTTVTAEEVTDFSNDHFITAEAADEAEAKNFNTYYSSETNGPKDYSIEPVEGLEGWYKINGAKVLYLYKEGNEGALIGTDGEEGDSERLLSVIRSAGVETLKVGLTDMQSEMGKALEAAGAEVCWPGITYEDDNSGAMITIGKRTLESLAVKGHAKSSTVWIDKTANAVISGDSIGDGTVYLLDMGWALSGYNQSTQLKSMIRFRRGVAALKDAINEETTILTNGKKIDASYVEDMYNAIDKIIDVDHEAVHKYIREGVGEDHTANFLTEEGSASIVWHNPGLGYWGYELAGTDFNRTSSGYLDSEDYEDRGLLGYDFFNILYDEYDDGVTLSCIKDTDIQAPFVLMNDKIALLMDCDMYGDLCAALKPMIGDRDLYIFITHPHLDHYYNIGQFLPDGSELKEQIIANYKKQYENRSLDMSVYGGTNHEDTPGVTLGLEHQLKGVFMAEGGLENAAIVGVKLTDVFAEFEKNGTEITIFKTGDLDPANDTEFSIGEGEYKMDFTAIYMQGHTAGDFMLLDKKHRALFSGDVLGTPAATSGYSMGAVPYPVALDYVNKVGDNYGEDFDYIYAAHTPYAIPRAFLNNNKNLLESYVKYGKAASLYGQGRQMVIWGGELNTTGFNKDGLSLNDAPMFHDAIVLWNCLCCSISARTGKTNTVIQAEDLSVELGKTLEGVFSTNNTESLPEYTVEDESIVSVGVDGSVTGLAEGSTTVKIFSPVTRNFETAEKTVAVTVVPAAEPVFKDVQDPESYYYDSVYWAYYYEPQITTGTGPDVFSPDVNVKRGQMVTFLWRLAGEPEPETDMTFNDVDPDKYYAKAISWAAENGITTGYADGSGNFGPDNNCTREQIVTFVWRYADKPAPEAPADFTDLKVNAYYLDAVAWAAENGITVGLNDGTGRFGVGMSCTRGMAVTFLYRFAEDE